MKIALILLTSLVIAIRWPLTLLSVWIITCPVARNIIASPWQNPFFGSYRLVDRFITTSGFSIRELFDLDRMVLLLLIVIFIIKGERAKTKTLLIDIPFLLFLLSMFIGSFYSNSFFHRFRIGFDTFGMCFAGYYLAKNYLFSDRRFKIVTNSILAYGLLIIGITIAEFLTYRHEFMYRVTGPFLYWEHLGLSAMVVLFVAIYRKSTSENKKWHIHLFYLFIIIMSMWVIIMAQTRTIIAAILVAFIFMSIRGWRIVNRRIVILALIVVLAVTVLLVSIPSLITDTNYYKYRLTARTDVGRTEENEVSLRIFALYPLFGIGFRDFTEDKLDYLYTGEKIESWGGLSSVGTIHNSYLAVLSELGLMGILPMISLILATMFSCETAFRLSNNHKDQYFVLTMSAILIVYWLSATTFDPIFEPTIENRLVFILLGITVGRMHNRDIVLK